MSSRLRDSQQQQLRGFEHEHEYELLSTKYLKAKTRKGCRTF